MVLYDVANRTGAVVEPARRVGQRTRGRDRGGRIVPRGLDLELGRRVRAAIRGATGDLVDVLEAQAFHMRLQGELLEFLELDGDRGLTGRRISLGGSGGRSGTHQDSRGGCHQGPQRQTLHGISSYFSAFWDPLNARGAHAVKGPLHVTIV